MAVLLASCGGTAPSPSPSPSQPAPARSSPAVSLPPPASAKPPSAAASAQAKPQTVRLFFTANGKLTTETAQVSGTTPAQAALTLLLKGPKTSGHITEIPKGTELQSVSIQNKVATVSFNPAFFTEGGASGTQLRLAQVVFTVTQFPEATSVQLVRDGQTVGLIGEGFPLNRPLTRGDFASVNP